jgi:hypothetical protein
MEAKATILWIFAAGLAIVLQIWTNARTSTRVSAARRFPGLIAISLASVALALVGVGVVSGTLRTHLVQISPLVLLLALLARAPALGSAAAAAVLSFWLVTMAGIWLFLLGLSRFLTGTFSPTEIFLTLFIGLACLAGLLAHRRSGNLPLRTSVPIDRTRGGPAISGAVAQLSANYHQQMISFGSHRERPNTRLQPSAADAIMSRHG